MDDGFDDEAWIEMVRRNDSSTVTPLRHISPCLWKLRFRQRQDQPELSVGFQSGLRDIDTR